ncbi:malate dehydrogenase [uncultured Arcobacter sp.]|uniref:malate dehydrogenase n=1 Tax=uncultured Arcobacter sp. TaxID=165434 RepID=UPI002626B26B|nr:malate dehydrogenase [uncultured Arcobacter sp.]
MKNRKIGIIGTGNVGATLAFTLAIKNICSTILLKDIRDDLSQAMALDISQATHALKLATKIIAIKDNKDFHDCDIVVITAGIARKPGMSRDDLLFTNAKIMKNVVEDIIQHNPTAILIIVSNPLDVMVYQALKVSNLSNNRVIGMAGILDSARMSHFIEEKLSYGIGEIDAQVMGGHGNDMVPLTSLSKVKDKNLQEVLNDKDIDEIVNKTKHAGAQIVELLGTGSAYFAPASSTAIIIDAILNDKKEIHPCAVMLSGEYGFNDIVAGVPVILGKNGVEGIIELNLDESQKFDFMNSVATVRNLIETLNSNN